MRQRKRIAAFLLAAVTACSTPVHTLAVERSSEPLFWDGDTQAAPEEEDTDAQLLFGDGHTTFDGETDSGQETPPPGVESGETEGTYGKLKKPVGEEELARLRAMSRQAPVEPDPDKEVTEEDLNMVSLSYFNGEAYRGGDLSMAAGDSFSYTTTCAKSDYMAWEAGSWFELVLFKVPGLELTGADHGSIVWEGIKTGEYFLTYESQSGEMHGKAVFNQYASLFEPDSAMVSLKVNGFFGSAATSGAVEIGGKEGNLTIIPRPDLPEPSPIPGGTGWQPKEAPEFYQREYPFGSGIRWDNSGDPHAHEPQMEWRTVFLEQLQKEQEDFVNQGEDYQFQESDGSFIIRYTLDENQEFYVPPEEADKFGEENPFYLELPMVVPGIGTLLNGELGAGEQSYDGPGSIPAIVGGDKFRKITDKNSEIAEKKVEETPLSYTIRQDSKTGQETLVINVGKLGTTDPISGLTWDLVERKYQPVEFLEEKIAECDNRIEAIQAGSDSPVALLDARKSILSNLLKTAANGNQEAEELIANWEEAYRQWREKGKVGPLQPLESAEELAKLWLPQKLLDLTVREKGVKVSETEAYQNYGRSLQNLKEDQGIYLKNRSQYGQDWQAAKERFTKTREFYEGGRVYGFVLNVRTKARNTTVSDYQSHADVKMDDKKWSASAQIHIQFPDQIVENGQGELVLQKADQFFATEEPDQTDIQKVEEEQAGLFGAEFQVYEGDSNNPVQFLGKDASVRGDTYRYVSAEKNLSPGAVTDLTVNEDGRLLLSGVPEEKSYSLVETKAPDGYYLDSTPVPVKCQPGEITYQLVPNVSRSVLLSVRDAHSDSPIEGVEFALYKNEPQSSAIGFKSRDLNGHQTYWYDPTGGEALKTNAGGELCIHGLQAGSYVLKAAKAALGYAPSEPSEIPFTLKEERPKTDANGKDGDQQYDKDGHLLLTAKMEPETASLTLRTKNERGGEVSDAGFALFRFTGTEEEWNGGLFDNINAWKWVDVHTGQEEGEYFKTTNKIEDMKQNSDLDFPSTIQWKKAVFTSNEMKDFGSLTITEIPQGHYAIAEVQVPKVYVRDSRSLYFEVKDKEKISLYWDPAYTEVLPENQLVCHLEYANLALVKYDEAQGQPKIQGEKIGEDGWQYTKKVLAEENQSHGIPDVVYKLFQCRGTDPNPDPEDKITEEFLTSQKPQYDPCLAIGKTDPKGVLKSSEMKDDGGRPVLLPPGNYYMVEITPPDGYLRNENPIVFELDESVYPEGTTDPKAVLPGLVKLAPSQKADYGLQLRKVDGSDTGKGLPGAEFTVKQEDSPLVFTGSQGSYRLAKKGTQGAVSQLVTGADGLLTVTGLAKNTTYTFTETKAPKGYQRNETEIQGITAASEEVGITDGNVIFPFPSWEIQVENQRILGTAEITLKAGETFAPLAKAEFSLYKIQSTGDEDSTDPLVTGGKESFVGTTTTDEKGKAFFKNLEWNTRYVIRETAAPGGYLPDGTQYSFYISEHSIDQNGNLIPVRYTIYNYKGNPGRAKLTKADADDHNIKLPGACFRLEKKMGTDAAGEEIWTGYGEGSYETDDKGELALLLPPGDYRLTETKAPEGYLLDGSKILFFTIPEEGSQEIVIDETEDPDGIVENQKGVSAGVRIHKILGDSDTPIPNVTFQIGRKSADSGTGQPFSFVQNGDQYLYASDPKTPGATTELITDEKGLIQVQMPAELGDPELYFWETEVPEHIEKDPSLKSLTLTEGKYTDVQVSNQLSEEAEHLLSIKIQKVNSQDQNLPGAEFVLYQYAGTGGIHVQIGKGTTDADGTLVFDEKTLDPGQKLKVGEIYHIVETKAPDGYVLDETHHEVILDESCFDENFQFIGPELKLSNDTRKGSVTLKKVDKDQPDKGLPGAEFELQKKSSSNQWEHYGEWRYLTDEKGILQIESLPFGTYQLTERTAPLGYLLDDPAQSVEFQITEENAHVQLQITNKADPNPVRDVQVKKVAAENHALTLPGAQFQLFKLEEDGVYHLLQNQVYVTDAKGSFTIKGLPEGNYGLKEIQPPSGYEISGQDMTYFVVKKEEPSVSLQIENRKIQSGGNPGGGGEVIAITGVVVSPEKVVLQKGDSQQFAAEVQGIGSYNPDVLWSISGNTDSRTKVDENGRLTVGEEETASTITVKATAVGDRGKYGTALVTVEEQAEPKPPVSGVEILKVIVKGNRAEVILSGEAEGATGYDFVIGKDRDCIRTKDYYKVNKNQLLTRTTFYYVEQGTYYAYCHAWKRVDGKKVFGSWSEPYQFQVRAVTPKQPRITKVKVSKNTVTVTYTRSKGAIGYDLVLGKAVRKVNGELRPVDYGKLVKKVYKGNTVTATFKNVKKGMYYAGLHAYNRTSKDGKKVFSLWSPAKKIRVK